ncbi:MAG: hypothetical protein P8Y27_13920, partial [Chromatiaceae bacterium]
MSYCDNDDGRLLDGIYNRKGNRKGKSLCEHYSTTLPNSTSHLGPLQYAVDTRLYVVEKAISEAIGRAFIEGSGLVPLLLRTFTEVCTHFRSPS